MTDGEDTGRCEQWLNECCVKPCLVELSIHLMARKDVANNVNVSPCFRFPAQSLVRAELHSGYL